MLEAAAMAEAQIPRPMVAPREETASVKAETYGIYYGLDDNDVEILHVLGLVVSSVSFFATCISGYWLVRMRRSFRHE